MKKQTTTDFSTIRDLFTDFHRQKEDKKKAVRRDDEGGAKDI